LNKTVLIVQKDTTVPPLQVQAHLDRATQATSAQEGRPHQSNMLSKRVTSLLLVQPKEPFAQQELISLLKRKVHASSVHQADIAPTKA
jgi:hypothetical protein